MILFWGASALLAAVALFLVMRPLLRRRAAARVSRRALNIAVYRDQLRELEADLRAGTLAQADYERARRERTVSDEIHIRAVFARTQHQALLQRLESARLSGQAEASDAQGRFRIIDPPLVPLMPAGPRRRFFISIVLLASIGLGTGVALLLNELHPVFFSRNSLAAVTGLPVLGSIGVLRSKPLQPLLLKPPVLLEIFGDVERPLRV